MSLNNALYDCTSFILIVAIGEAGIMIVTTITKSYLNTVSLPDKITGRYWLYEETDNGPMRLVGIEGISDKWVLKSNRTVKVTDGKENVLKNTVAKPMSIYVLSKQNKEKIFVFTEPVTDDRQEFSKYLVENDVDIFIGRNERNDICFSNSFVSSGHAVLSYKSGHWYIFDNGSTNGTFVNKARIEKAELYVGDVVFIMGLKIIIGKNFIAFNNPDGRVTASAKLQRYISQPVAESDDEEEYELRDPDFFYRSPRFKRDIETAEFKIDSPPSSPVTEEMPWPLVIGSSMAMGMMSVVTVTNAAITGNVMSMVMGGSMMIGTLLMPMLIKTYERRRKKEKEVIRQKKYREYLNHLSVKINEASQEQVSILNENCITVGECENRIRNVQRNLWERAPGQNDFLRVRVGHGSGLLDAEFSYSERRFSTDDDILEEEMYILCERPKELHNIPITYSLAEDHISGIIGQKQQAAEFAKGLIIQLSALYSYDEVKLVFLYDIDDEDEFGFVKWLPHVWNDDNKFRFIATNNNEAKELSAYLENIVEARIAMNENDLKDTSPYFIIFSMSKTLAVHTEVVKQVLAKKENLNISVISIYDELKDLPKECSMVVELSGNRARLFDKNDISGKSTEFFPDIKPLQDPLDLSVRLANITLDNSATSFKLPRTLTFLEMFGVGMVEHLNALARWRDNDPTKSLEAAVGVDTLGETFKLDLHEKFHGPHGLVAGMTGSGKSEFIITYILSLAVNYHPNEVAFILIDYKGGGMAKSFEHLPHTAGIITNLDGAAIKRSLVSIESELKRRQAIFADASKKVGVSNIDIYKYQKLYREGTVEEPLQHLFIISDEFAELKTQQPEFMTQLVSAARIGRSLGVHLILATQKPSGVVDDQIWSNSKFRVCLKVQERADSMDMLKRPDAAELTDTGRFYLQVGYNELFELGQSAWSGAPYYPSETVVKEKDNSVAVIDRNGHVIKEVKPGRKNAGGNAKKQLDVITEYLKKTAEEEGIKIRPLWLEPIPAVIMMEDVKKKYSVVSERFKLNPVIGELDDPANQRQCVLRLPISEEGNAVVYGVAGSGKTTFLNAMIYSLIHEHTPDEVNLYILDFASETLRAFADAPHVGDVILSYEAEKVGNLFKMLLEETGRRKKLFANYGGDYSSYIGTSGETLPSIVVAINNFSAFTETYSDREEAVAFLSREGTKYGIYFVLTALGTTSVKFRMLQNFKQLLVMQLNDESDYSSVVGKTEGLYPAKIKGRGLIRQEALYEFQAASLTDESVPFAFIRDDCRKVSASWKGEVAKRVPILPEKVDVEFLRGYIRPNDRIRIPVGMEKSTLNVCYYPFGAAYINMVHSSGNEYQDFIADFAELAGTTEVVKGVVFDAPKSVSVPTGTLTLCNSAKDCESEVRKLFDLVLYRNNTYKDALAAGQDPEAFESVFVIINSLAALKGVLSQDANERLSLILEKGSVDYRINIVIAEQINAISAVSYEKWYKQNVSQVDGIWIGNGFSDQFYLKPTTMTPELRKPIGSGFGYVMQKGKCVKIKLLKSKTEEEDAE